MVKKWLTPILLLAMIFLFPQQSFAMDFSITTTKIDAYLQASGTVEVDETHTYQFDGEFNGITRELIPKQGTDITQLTASENGNPLIVEQEDHLYKVHRKGHDEIITVDLHYTIKNGIEVYQDVAQFYWPFFDDRNESTYENLSITIHPPEATDDVIAFGYDQAYNTETIHEDGSVLFHLKTVPSSSNGDIRVAYQASLFPAAAQTSTNSMREEILKAEEELVQQVAAKAETRETLATIAIIMLPAFTIGLLLLMMSHWLARRARQAAFLREGIKYQSLPPEILSLPATIYFMNQTSLPSQAMAAALLDLVRQGYVNETSTNHFQMTGKKSTVPHEFVLMKWLFEKIGTNGAFSFADLTAYTKNKKNHPQYHEFQTQWRKEVKQEVDSHILYEKKTTYRLIIGFSSLLLVPFLFLFPIHDLFISFFAALLLFFTVIIYAISYTPRTWEGAQIAYDWKHFKAHFKTTPPTVWEKWSEDDRMRAYIYGLGMNDKDIGKKNEELTAAFGPARNDGGSNHYHPASIYSIAYLGPIASSNFHVADQSTGSTSSGGSSSGGGTGGGGGGSGAF
jgi:uncharacterized membrane protein YgcG